MNILSIVNARLSGTNPSSQQIYCEKAVFTKNGQKKYFIVVNGASVNPDVKAINITGRYTLSVENIPNEGNSIVINITSPIIEPATKFDGGSIYVTLTGCGVKEDAKPTQTGNKVWFNARYGTGNTSANGKAEVRSVAVFTAIPPKPITANQTKNLIGMKWDAAISQAQNGQTYINETVYDYGVETAYDPYKAETNPHQGNGYQSPSAQQQGNGYQASSAQQQSNGYQSSPAQQNTGYQAQSVQQQSNGYQSSPAQQQNTGYKAPPAQQQSYPDLDLSGFEEIMNEDLY